MISCNCHCKPLKLFGGKAMPRHPRSIYKIVGQPTINQNSHSVALHNSSHFESMKPGNSRQSGDSTSLDIILKLVIPYCTKLLLMYLFLIILILPSIRGLVFVVIKTP
jgi:hypothetical protein